MCMPNKALEAKFWLHSKLVGRLNPSTFLCGAQQHVPLHLALVHEALAAELAGVPRLATVHGLLVFVELHPAVKHLTTQCSVQPDSKPVSTSLICNQKYKELYHHNINIHETIINSHCSSCCKQL